MKTSDHASYKNLLSLAIKIQGQINSLPDPEKMSAMYIYLQTIIKIAKINASLLTEKTGISTDIIPKLGNFLLSIIQQEQHRDRCIASQSLMDLSTSAYDMQRLLYDAPVVFVEKSSLQESICWNVAIFLSRNEGIDLLFELFRLLGRTSSSSTDEEYIESNIKLLVNFLDRPKDQQQIGRCR